MRQKKCCHFGFFNSNNMYKIGEKVVCINDSIGYLSNIKSLLINEIYTIKSIRKETGALAFNEITAPINSSGFFNSNRFRKLDYEFAEDCLKNITNQFVNQYIPEFQPS